MPQLNSTIYLTSFALLFTIFLLFIPVFYEHTASYKIISFYGLSASAQQSKTINET